MSGGDHSVGRGGVAVGGALTAVFSRRPAAQGRWRFVRWDLLGVVGGGGESRFPTAADGDNDPAGGGAASGFKIAAGGALLRGGDNEALVGWPGMRLILHRDLAESYWANLAAAGALFVICRGDGDDFYPHLLTIAGEEAAGFAETDDAVFQTPLPPPLYQAAERFVLDNYIPAPRKKRRLAQAGDRR